MPHTLPDTDAHQERLLARADASADAAGAAVLRVWLDVLRTIKAGGSWGVVYSAARHALHSLPLVADSVAADLAAAHRAAATWTAEKLAATLPPEVRAIALTRRGLVEDVTTGTDLLVSVLLPPLDAAAVQRVIHATGWASTIRRLTALAAPDALAARIASAVQQGLSVQQIAREVRPIVQNVEASARRVARTAGLWVAHSAEMEVYEQLDDIIEGYEIVAVLDSRTRPEHRARNGTRYYRQPVAGQKGFGEMPRPPREADGRFAFNCRCFLKPLIRGS